MGLSFYQTNIATWNPEVEYSRWVWLVSNRGLVLLRQLRQMSEQGITKEMSARRQAQQPCWSTNSVAVWLAFFLAWSVMWNNEVHSVLEDIFYKFKQSAWVLHIDSASSSASLSSFLFLEITYYKTFLWKWLFLGPHL